VLNLTVEITNFSGVNMSGSEAYWKSTRGDFRLNLGYAILYMANLLNDRTISPGIDNLTQLDKYIKKLKKNIDASNTLSGYKVEKGFAAEIFSLSERVRGIKMEQQKYDQGVAARERAVDALLEAGRRSTSPYMLPKTIKEEGDIKRRLSSPPPPFVTGGLTGASVARSTQSPRTSDLNSSYRPVSGSLERQATRSTSPYMHPMQPPSPEEYINLNDEISALKAKIDEYYNTIDEKLKSKQVSGTPKGNKPKS
jgi:hypothetical protein